MGSSYYSVIQIAYKLKKMRSFALILAALASCEAAPWLGYGLGLGYHYPLVHHAVVTGGSVSVAVGGYKAVAGEGGAVHEVPGLFGAPAVLKQESEGGISLSTGTGAYHLIGKREADPALLAGYPYLGGYGLGYGLGYGYGYPYPYGVVATAGSGSPVAVGGYKAVAGEGGAVHEVPALFGAPAVLKQESEGGVSLSTGTGAYLIG